MARGSIKTLQWQHRYVAIFKCYHTMGRTKERLAAEELTVADSDEIEREPNLRRVLGTLQRDLVAKRLYSYADNPTSRLLTFRSYPEGQANEGQVHLNALLGAEDKLQVRTLAQELAQRYVTIPAVREGVLIFLISRGELDRDVAGNCVFVFKCNFEQVSQITPDELFRRVQDAIVEQTKKGALYPYFYRGQFDDTTVRVFDELGETQYWLDFLDLGERVAERVSLQTAVLEQLPDEVKGRYAEQIEELSSVRPLADEDRWFMPEDRYSTSQIKTRIQAVTRRVGEHTITLRLGQVRITAPLSEYGHTWIIAEEEGERYFLAKGFNLESRTRMLTPIDLADLPSLEDAVAELNM